MYSQHEMMTGIMYTHMEECLLHTSCTAVLKRQFHDIGIPVAKYLLYSLSQYTIMSHFSFS